MLVEILPAISLILILIFNFIFYYVLKKKYNFEMNVFLYGVGFTSCCVMLVFFIHVVLNLNGAMPWNILSLCIFYMFAFILLYYSYATLLRSNKKEASKIPLYLTIMTVITFLILTGFEIIMYGTSIACLFLLFFGLYLACCFIFEEMRFSLRVFAWSLFLPLLVVFCYSFLTAQFM